MASWMRKSIFCPPAGYTKVDGKECKLKRSLYDLQQASKQWNKEFTAFDQAFIQSKQDYSVFARGSGTIFVAVLVYIDDILINRKDTIAILHLK